MKNNTISTHYIDVYVLLYRERELTERGYKQHEINESIQGTQTFDRNELLKEK